MSNIGVNRPCSFVNVNDFNGVNENVPDWCT